MRRFLAIPLCGLLLLGCQHNQKTQKQAALEQWNGARAGVLLSMAQSQYQTGNLDRCRASVNEALKLTPDDAHLHILSAKLAIETGQMELAARDLDRARALDPKNAEADYLTGVVQQRWQQHQAALDSYTRANDKAPEQLAYLLARSEMLVLLDRHGEALRLLQEKTVHFEHSSAIRDAVGQLLMMMHKPAEAAEAFRQASILAPEELPLRERLALALHAAGQHREAAEVLGRLLRAETYQNRVDLWVAMGECQLAAGRPREARESFDAATARDATTLAGWLGVGKAALQLNDLKRCELAIKRALAVDGKSAAAHLLNGYLKLKQARPGEALAAFNRAVSLGGEDVTVLCMMGEACRKLGQVDKAEWYFERARLLDPRDPLPAQLSVAE